MLSKLEKRLKESWIKLDEDLTAFHGTGNSVPHNRFDINKIGSKGGDGGQVKGWGLYFAGEKSLAQYYRQKLNGTLFPVRPTGFNLDGTTYMKDNGKFLKGNGKEISKDEYAKAFRAAQAEEETNSKNGKLYQVDIPEQEEYLNLDHPMTSEFQSNSVLSAFEKARQQFPDKIRGSRGDSFYQSLANLIGSQKGASLWLKDHGVPGSCFKDQVSSERGGSSYTYVIFDDSKINIKGIEESNSNEKNTSDKSYEEIKRLVDIEEKLMKKAKSVGDMSTATKHAYKIGDLWREWKISVVENQMNINGSFSYFTNDEINKIEIIHPDITNKGKFRVTRFLKTNGTYPIGHDDNLTREEAIENLASKLFPVAISKEKATKILNSWGTKPIEESDEEFLSYSDKQKPIDDELNKQLKVLMDKWESEGIECYFYTKHDDLTLSRIIIPKEKRGQGLGSEKIKELQRFAAKHNLRILLTPDKSLGATSKGRLEKFYRGLGFYKNAGRNKDFRTSETFIWRPNAK